MATGLLPLPSFLRASAQDAANMRMRKAGRTRWARGDYNEAVRKLEALVAGHYGEGVAGQYRFQVAEELQRAGYLSLRMSLKQMNATIDAAMVPAGKAA